MAHRASIGATFVLLSIAILGGCATRRPTRPTNGVTNDPPPSVKKANAWYIESKPLDSGKPISCSFVEFDERGDYLDFEQHRNAYNKIKQLATNGERLLIVIYLHGWKNNSQSGDVVEFNNFLVRLANSAFAKDGGFRVHGIYLSWRGNSFEHALDTSKPSFSHTEDVYGQRIVDRGYARNGKLGWLLWIPEQLSYWNRMSVAENKASGVPLIRTIYTLGYVAQRYNDTNQPNRVLLMGHSMGALMLEKSFAPASLSRLTAEWPWDDENLVKQAKANPLPFDLTLLVNSAAPSIYAKEFFEFMAAHHEALRRDNVLGSDSPLVISLTSTADWATGKAHPAANLLAPFYPSLWRKYKGSDFILTKGDAAEKTEIRQAYYYARTPGHNPLLVNHWVVSPPGEYKAPAETNLLHWNLTEMPLEGSEAGIFFTAPRSKKDSVHAWQLTKFPPDTNWSYYNGIKPISVDPDGVKAGYWIIQCPKEIIAGHNDIWCEQAIDTYAALIHEAEFLRNVNPQTSTN